MIRQQKASKLSFIILYSFLFNLYYILLQLGYTHMVCMCLNCSSEFSKMLRYPYFQILNKYNHLRMIKIQLRMKGRNSKVEISPLCLPSFLHLSFCFSMGPVSTYWKPTLYQRMRSEEDRHGPYPWHMYRTCMTSREIPQTSENRKGMKILCGKASHRPLSVILKSKMWKLLVQEHDAVLKNSQGKNPMGQFG